MATPLSYNDIIADLRTKIETKNPSTKRGLETSIEDYQINDKNQQPINLGKATLTVTKNDNGNGRKSELTFNNNITLSQTGNSNDMNRNPMFTFLSNGQPIVEPMVGILDKPLFTPVPAPAGGKRNKSNKSKTPKRGGSVLAKLAAPGVLLVASELYKRRQSRTSKNKSRKFRKTRKYGRK
jgi:hypothetical protein